MPWEESGCTSIGDMYAAEVFLPFRDFCMFWSQDFRKFLNFVRVVAIARKAWPDFPRKPEEPAIVGVIDSLVKGGKRLAMLYRTLSKGQMGYKSRRSGVQMWVKTLLMRSGIRSACTQRRSPQMPGFN